MIPADAKLMIHHYSNLQFFQFLAEKIIFLFSVLEERQFSSPTFLQQIGNGFQRHKFLKNVFQKKNQKNLEPLCARRHLHNNFGHKFD